MSTVYGLQATVRGLRLTFLVVLLGMATAAPGLAASDGVATDAKTPATTTGERSDAAATAAVPATPTAGPSPVASGEALTADTLPGGAVPWASLPAPPALGGAMVQGGGGGGPTFEYYALDALGSVRVVFDAAGAVKARADYEPFGSPIPSSTTGPLPREQFTSQQRDSEVGLDYFGARFYHAAHGRMLSVDPLYVGAVGDPQRWNRYAHVLNTPLNALDPDGRLTFRTQTIGNCGGTCFPADEPSINTLSAGQAPQLGYDGGNADYEWLNYQAFGYRVVAEPCGGLTACSPAGGPSQSPAGTSNSAATKTTTTSTTTTPAPPPPTTMIAQGHVRWLASPQTQAWVSQQARSLLAKVVDFFTRPAPRVGDRVYRVFGGATRAEGQFWSPRDPRTFGDLTAYARQAGLPPGNTMAFMVEGKILNTGSIVVQRSVPGGAGNPGGMWEFQFFQRNSVEIVNVVVLKP
jgi:RHS repeat-associated protein